MENTQQPKVIRNASLAELDSLKKRNAIPAVPKHLQEETINKTTTESVLTSKKPNKSVFEPKAYPVKLPSRDFFINKEFLSDNYEILVRRMGSLEESLFFNMMTTDDPKVVNSTIDSVIDNCIKTNISVYDLSLIDKFTVFFKILDLTYGKFDIKVKCPECKLERNLEISLVDDLFTKYLPDNYQYPKIIKLKDVPSDFKINWYLRYMSIKQAQDFLASSSVDVMLELTEKIEGEFIDEDGQKAQVSKENYKDIVEFLGDTDRDEYKDFMNDFGSYGTEFKIKKYHCENRACDNFVNQVPFEFPIDQIFERIFNLKKFINKIT